MRVYILLTMLLVLSLAGCDSFVEDVDLPITSIDDAQLNDESQIPFLIKGVQSRFAITYARFAVFSGGISDELFFDLNVIGASRPSFREMDLGQISFTNFDNENLYRDVGALRLHADILETRITKLTFEDANLQQEALFTANFYGGIARYFYAVYYGLDIRQGGGIITEDPKNPGPFIPSDQMFGLAIDKLNSAKLFADEYHTRVINTLIARIHLVQGNYTEARTTASAGMVDGDAPFNSLFAPEVNNYYYLEAGAARNQWVVDYRYYDYITADPAELNRIPIEQVSGIDGTAYYRQNLYPDPVSPLPFSTWQENELMLAELDIRDGNATNALNHFNAVRFSHSLSALTEATMGVLIMERDKELFTMGLRLIDQRRMDLWHLGDDAWWYLPITQEERNSNPNL